MGTEAFLGKTFNKPCIQYAESRIFLNQSGQVKGSLETRPPLPYYSSHSLVMVMRACFYVTVLYIVRQSNIYSSLLV
jgi:hypothetical protein